MSADVFGTPDRPMMVKSTALGDPGGPHVYVSAVTEKGNHLHLGFSRSQIKLLGWQMAQAAMKEDNAA